jgi:hypothetical protein
LINRRTVEGPVKINPSLSNGPCVPRLTRIPVDNLVGGNSNK